MGFSKALPAYYSRAPLKARLKYSAGPRHQHSQPWLWKILIQHGQKQLQAALPSETLVPSPQSNTAPFAYVLLTRCLRSWTVLAPCGISWLTGCWRSRWIPSGSPGAEGSEMHTHTQHVCLSTAGSTLPFCVVGPQNALNPRPYHSWVSGQQVSKNCKIIFCSLVQRLAAHATRQWSAELHGHMQATERIHGIIPEFPWKDGLQA